MDYLPQLLAIQQQVNALVEQMTGVKTPPAKNAVVPDVVPNGPKKKRGRPSKKDLEAAAEAAAVAADAILAAGEPASEGPKKRGPQTPEAKAAAVAKRKATMERKKAEKAAEEEAMKRASEADEDAKSTVSATSVASSASKPKIKILKKTVPAVPEPPTSELSDDQEEKNRIVYRYMFQLQEAGINMMNSGSWLKKGFSLSNVDAEDYVLNYISNYETLRSKYGDA